MLLVEDDEAICEFVQAVLLDMGLTVDAASDGPRALRLAEEHRPTLVVLDLGLPGMSGKALGAELRQRYPDLPILVSSALARPHVAAAAREIGAFEFLTKPFDVDDFVAAVERGVRLGARVGSPRAG